MFDRYLRSVARGLHPLLPRRRKWLINLGSTSLLLAARVLRYEPILRGIGNYLIIKDDLQPADLIHILGGSRERTDYAIYLHQRGYGKALFFTGREIALFYKAHAANQGVPANGLLQVESNAQNTYQEALELKQLVDNWRPAQSVIIVSDPYHLRRVQWTFKRVLGNQVKIQFAPVPFEQSLDKQRWWTDRWSREMIVSEYLKLLFYGVRYRLNILAGGKVNRLDHSKL